VGRFGLEDRWRVGIGGMGRIGEDLKGEGNQKEYR
jgi:hypothetical protein